MAPQSRAGPADRLPLGPSWPGQASEGRDSAHHTKAASSPHRANVLGEGVRAEVQRVGSPERPPRGTGQTGGAVLPSLWLPVPFGKMEIMTPTCRLPGGWGKVELPEQRAWNVWKKWPRRLAVQMGLRQSNRQLCSPGSPSLGVEITPRREGAPLCSPRGWQRPGGIQLWLTRGQGGSSIAPRGSRAANPT